MHSFAAPGLGATRRDRRGAAEEIDAVERYRYLLLFRFLPTPTVAPPLARLRLTHNPSRSTVEPEIGG